MKVSISLKELYDSPDITPGNLSRDLFSLRGYFTNHLDASGWLCDDIDHLYIPPSDRVCIKTVVSDNPCEGYDFWTLRTVRLDDVPVMVCEDGGDPEGKSGWGSTFVTNPEKYLELIELAKEMVEKARNNRPPSVILKDSGCVVHESFMYV